MKFKTVCCLLLGFVCSCSDKDPEPLAEPKPPVLIIKVPNGSFEDGIVGWSIDGNDGIAKIVEGGCEGNSSLLCESSPTGNIVVSQTVGDLEDGIYDLEFYYKNSGNQTACYVSSGSEASGLKMTSMQVSPSSWTRSYVRGIKVEEGKCDINIHYISDTASWCRIDLLNLKKTEKEYALLKGGDISQLSIVEQNGGKYYENGEEKDCIRILKDNGFNIIRLRLYNDPGNPDYSPSNKMPRGFQDSTDILNLAKRAKDAGLKIQLTFHYSDYWTNPGMQEKPHEWADLDYEGLKKAFYDFTYNFMEKMKAQGTSPDFVSLGNETNSGLLFPDADYNNYDKAAELYSLGYDAVKAVSPESRVIIHISEGGDKVGHSYYFNEMAKYGAKYDVIGASYYPFWTRRTAIEVRDWANYISKKFDKDIMIMETGYNWNPTLPSGYPGQLTDNGPYDNVYPSTPLGQKNFMLELFNEIKKVDDCRIIGCLYWDPVHIFVPGVERLGDGNIVSNTTLFDFTGNRLEVFDAFKYNN